jgi:excinuclease ABC subunit A
VASRLRFLSKVGLDYVTLDRPTNTLSGGEFQRARLAGFLGSGLIGVCYVLDEPTIGLHARDTGRLVDLLGELRDRGNSVVVVEHDPETMRRADCIIDLGPGAGSEGGTIVAVGSPKEIAGSPDSITGRYLLGSSRQAPSERRLRNSALVLEGANLHNLKDLTVEIPLGVMTCVTGVSGSGKSSLVAGTLVPAIRRALERSSSSEPSEFAESGQPAGPGDPSQNPFRRLTGVEDLERLVEVDQSPIGRSGRSNPATYSGVWDEVRKVFAKTRDARLRGYSARRFSFNSPGGRCEACKGHGTKKIEMHFLPEVHVACPTCRGTRFNRQTRAVRYAGKNVADVLEMRIDEAASFFASFPALQALLATLSEVGLGYLALGQSSLTLSGGEAQRVRLARELARAKGGKTLFVLDEPTTGLHPADVAKLVGLLHRLVDQGDSVLVVEHQLDVIAAADWVIDLGPEGGAEGGQIVAEGPPEAVAENVRSHTGRALDEYLRRGR